MNNKGALMRRAIALIVGVILATGMVVAADLTPASASYQTCINGHGCVYTNTFGGGSQGDIPFSTFYPGCHNFSSPFLNTISSVDVLYGNNHGLEIFDGFNCTGYSLTIPALKRADDLSTYQRGILQGDNWNDVAKSFLIT